MPGLPDSLVDLLASRALELAAGGAQQPAATAALLAAAEGDWTPLQLAHVRLSQRNKPKNTQREAALALLSSAIEQANRRSKSVTESPAQIVEVPARQGRALRIAASERFRIIDLEGGQVADVFAFCADDLSEYHSAQHTRVHLSRLFPRCGEHFVTNKRRPILQLEADDSPGPHDMLCAACDPTRYATLSVDGWHASCQENLQLALAELGLGPVEVPQPINLFMNTPPQPDGAIAWLPAMTRPLDSVTLKAELDLILVVFACPQDIVAINHRTPTSLAIERLTAPARESSASA